MGHILSVSCMYRFVLSACWTILFVLLTTICALAPTCPAGCMWLGSSPAVVMCCAWGCLSAPSHHLLIHARTARVLLSRLGTCFHSTLLGTGCIHLNLSTPASFHHRILSLTCRSGVHGALFERSMFRVQVRVNFLTSSTSCICVSRHDRLSHYKIPTHGSFQARILSQFSLMKSCRQDMHHPSHQFTRTLLSS
jgi:hypothetical protein